MTVGNSRRQVSTKWCFETVNRSVIVALTHVELKALNVEITDGLLSVVSQKVDMQTNYHLLVHVWPSDARVSVMRCGDLLRMHDAIRHAAGPISTLLALGAWRPMQTAVTIMSELLQLFPQWRDYGWNEAHAAAVLGHTNVFAKLQDGSSDELISGSNSGGSPGSPTEDSSGSSNRKVKLTIPQHTVKKARKLLNFSRRLIRGNRQSNVRVTQSISADGAQSTPSPYLTGIAVEWLARPPHPNTLKSCALIDRIAASPKTSTTALPVPYNESFTTEQLKTYKKVFQAKLQSHTRTSRLTPLMLTAIFKQHDAFEILIDLNNMINTEWLMSRDMNGNNVLHLLAWRHQSIDLFHLLHEKVQTSELHQLLGHRNRFGCWPMHVACFRKNLPFIYTILRLKLPLRLLVISCPNVTSEGVYECADVDVDVEVDIDIDPSVTPASNLKPVKYPKLNISADHNSPSRVRTKTSGMNKLVQLSEKALSSFINSEVVRGGCPLHWTNSSSVMSELLVEGFRAPGVCVNVLREQPMHVAVRWGFWLNAITLFYQTHGHWSGRGDEMGETPLHVAVRKRSLLLVQLLLLLDQQNSALNQVNRNGHSSRHLAARRLCIEDENVLNALHVSGAIRCNTISHVANSANASIQVTSCFTGRKVTPSMSTNESTSSNTNRTDPEASQMSLDAVQSIGEEWIPTMATTSMSETVSQSFRTRTLNTQVTSDQSSFASFLQNEIPPVTNCTSGCAVQGTYNGLEILSKELPDSNIWLADLLSESSLNALHSQLKAQVDSLSRAPDCSLDPRDKKKLSQPLVQHPQNPIRTSSTSSPNKKVFFDSLSNHSTRTHDENFANRTTANKPSLVYNLYRVLSVDGGGVRGLVAVQVLLELQRHLKHPFNEYFNWYGGTSTGSLVCALVTLGYSLTDIRLAYLLLKSRVFSGTFVCDSSRFESYLKRLAGERTLNKISHCKLTVTSTMFDRKPLKLHLFRNYATPEQLLNLNPVHATFGTLTQENTPKPKAIASKAKPLTETATTIHPPSSTESSGGESLSDLVNAASSPDATEPPVCPDASQIRLWHVCRASSAAPRMFAPVGSFCDGGVLSNNPALDLISELHLYNQIVRQKNPNTDMKEDKIQLLLSIGTGRVNSKPTNRYAYDFSSLTQRRYMNPLSWYSAILATWKVINLLSSACTLTDGHVLNRLVASCYSADIPFVRINSLLSRDVRTNEREDRILIQAMFEVCSEMRSKRNIVQKLVEVLEYAHTLSQPQFSRSHRRLLLQPGDWSSQSIDRSDIEKSEPSSSGAFKRPSKTEMVQQQPVENLLRLLLNEMDE